jgi:hypothetical protein
VAEPPPAPKSEQLPSEHVVPELHCWQVKPATPQAALVVPGRQCLSASQQPVGHERMSQPAAVVGPHDEPAATRNPTTKPEAAYLVSEDMALHSPCLTGDVHAVMRG